MSETGILIAVLAAVTFLTRSGGYLVISRIGRIPPRLAMALDAVPAATLTTLVAPAIFAGGWREALALCVAALLGLRFGLTVVVAGAWVLLMALRHGTG